MLHVRSGGSSERLPGLTAPRPQGSSERLPGLTAPRPQGSSQRLFLTHTFASFCSQGAIF
ncbi:hypothetical protein EYF80_007378 [Liparis tanakae]|uniref:Uncharacterized protein n=1 Tax=Liparis tanakae TaxID=230148 RepID=A0A4Z2IXN0_9TELE|nr:hypothetical protein EYF80_007378 [Liparis tanakae]